MVDLAMRKPVKLVLVTLILLFSLFTTLLPAALSMPSNVHHQTKSVGPVKDVGEGYGDKYLQLDPGKIRGWGRKDAFHGKIYRDLYEKLLETDSTEDVSVIVTYGGCLEREMIARVSSRIESARITFAGTYVKVLVVRLPADRVTTLEEVEGVKHIFPDSKVELPYEREDPQDPLGLQRRTADLPRLYLNESTAIVGAPSVWDIGVTGRGVSIAVIDTGVNWTHPDLAGKVIISKSFAPGEDPMDYTGHGTHVAGIAAGTGAASGGKFRGVAPDANIMNIKVFATDGYALLGWVLAALDYTLSVEPDVVSMSWGAPSLPDSHPLNLYMAELAKKYIVPVAAAGNEAYHWIFNSPANSPYVISVGATAKNDRLARFTGKGPDPFTYRTLPTITAPGVNVVAPASGRLAKEYGLPEHPLYAPLSGTSMSTPHVSGAIALLVEAFPSALPNAITSALILGADDIGYDANKMGAGRLNVYKAYQILKDTPTLEAVVESGETRISSTRIRSRAATPPNFRAKASLSDAPGSADFDNKDVSLHVSDEFILTARYKGLRQGAGVPAFRYYDESGNSYFFYSHWARTVEPFTKVIDTYEEQTGYGTITDGNVNVTLSVSLYRDNRWMKLSLRVWSDLISVGSIKTYLYFDPDMAETPYDDTAEYIYSLDALISYDNRERYFLGISGLEVSTHYDCGDWRDVYNDVSKDSLGDSDHYTDDVAITMQWDDPDGFTRGSNTVQELYLSFEDAKEAMAQQLFDLVGRGHDVTIGRVEPKLVPEDREVEIMVEVNNIGLLDEANVGVVASIVVDNVSETEFPKKTIVFLPSGASATVTFRHTFKEAGRFWVNASIDPLEGETIHAHKNNLLSHKIFVGPLHLSAGVYPSKVTGFTSPIVTRFPGDACWFNLTAFTNTPLTDASLAVVGNATKLFSIQEPRLGVLEGFGFREASIIIPIDATPGVYTGTLRLLNGSDVMGQVPIRIEVVEPTARVLWIDMFDYALQRQFLWQRYVTYWQIQSLQGIRIIPLSLLGIEQFTDLGRFNDVVLIDPYYQFTPTQLDSLLKYVEGGGNLQVFYGSRVSHRFDAQTSSQYNLPEVTRLFGIDVTQPYYEPEDRVFPIWSNNVTLLEPDHPAIQNIANFTVVSGRAALKVSPPALPLVNVTDVLYGMNFTVMAVYEKAPYLGRLLVIANDFMFDDSWIDYWWDVEYIDETAYAVFNYTKKPGNRELARTAKAYSVGDIVKPTVSVVSPQNGIHIRGAVDARVSAEDGESGIDRLEFYLNNNLTLVDVEAPYEFNWNTGGYLDGVYAVKVVAYDRAGNMNFDGLQVTVDNTVPRVEIREPASDAYLRGLCDVVAHGFDINFEKMQLYIGDSLVQSWTQGGSQAFRWGTEANDDGAYAIKLIAYDKAGNMGEASIRAVVDNTMPSASIDSPRDGVYLKDEVTIGVTGGDANFDRMELYVSGELIDTWNTSGVQTHKWNTKAGVDGSYTVKLAVHDRAGNTINKSVVVVVDNTLPIVEIRTPIDGQFIGGPYNIVSHGFDANLERVELYIDETLIDAWVEAGIRTYVWNTVETGDGEHLIRAVAYDKAKNLASVSVGVTLDNTPPSISFTEPAEGADIPTTGVTVRWTASDGGGSGIHGYMIEVDGGGWIDVGRSTSYTLTDLRESPHRVKIKALDVVGNVGEATSSFTVGRSRASSQISQTESEIEVAKRAAFWSGEARSLLSEAIGEFNRAREAFDAGDFGMARVYAQTASNYVSFAHRVDSSLRVLTLIGVGAAVAVIVGAAILARKRARLRLSVQ
ncbi:MAG: S8 family serine peptidase [Candidatus Geothermarchaeales archaeon]